MSAGGHAERARAAGWRLTGEPPVLEALAAEVLTDAPAAARRGSVLRATTDRVVSRLTLAGVGDVLLKVERSYGLEEAVRGWFHPTRASSEWAAARALVERGVPVPEPLALAERGGALAGRLTAYVGRFLPDVEPLSEVLPRLSAEAAGALLSRVGALIAQMHAAGFDHRDLHPGNVLVGSGASPSLTLIDLHRGRLASPSEADCDAALARLLSGLRAAALSEEEAHASLLEGWLGGKPPTPAVLAARLAPRIAALRRARQAKHDAWALVPCPWYAAVPGPGEGLSDLAGVRDLALAPHTLRLRLEEHDALLARHDPRVLKDRPKSAVTRHGDVVVKETRLKGWRVVLKRLLTPGRLVAGHVNAHRLRVRAIPTARSLACVRRGARRFTLYQDLSALPRLDDLVRRLYGSGARREQARLRAASADWLADLHARGVYHGDVKALHVLVEGGLGAPRFVLIDTDRLKLLGARVSASRRLKNLAQLDASIPVNVTRTERLRWWRRYAERLGAGDLEPQVERRRMRRLGALLARKRRVVHASIE